MYETADIRKNLKIVIDGAPWVVIDFQHVKPGKGNAFTRTRIKNMITGSVLDKTYKTGERFEPAALEEHDMQFLYKEGNRFHFMNNATYEQVELDDDHVGDAANWITENLSVKILYFRDQPIGVTPPNFVELEVIESDPGSRATPPRAPRSPRSSPPARRSSCRCSSSRATGCRSTPAPRSTSGASRVRAQVGYEAIFRPSGGAVVAPCERSEWGEACTSTPPRERSGLPCWNEK